MRLIETKMNNAIRKRQNFSNSNTTVKTTSFFDNDVYCEESEVFLHGNHIATYNHVTKELSDIENFYIIQKIPTGRVVTYT